MRAPARSQARWRAIDTELRGETIFPVGAYRRIDHFALRWARLESHPEDRAVLGTAGAPHGYVRVIATIVFDRVEVPLVLAFVPEARDQPAPLHSRPERAGAELHFRIAAHAGLDFGNRAFQWVSDKLGGDKLATRLARSQINDVLLTTLAPPPPFELSGGQTLAFTYCDDPIEIAEGAYGALPFAVAIGSVDRAPEVRPPRFGPGARSTPSTATTLAIDLDLDALDAMLFELWRTGWLDRQLAGVGLDRQFNTDPTVTEYLSIRISPLRLALPPVIEPGPRGSLHLAAEGRLAIADGAQTTVGRLFGALDFRFAPPGAANAASRLPVTVELGALELACERAPTTLVPCYGDLVAALSGRGADFGGALTQAFARLLADVFVDRHVAATGLPAALVIRRAEPRLTAGVGSPSLHLELDATLTPR